MFWCSEKEDCVTAQQFASIPLQSDVITGTSPSHRQKSCSRKITVCTIKGEALWPGSVAIITSSDHIPLSKVSNPQMLTLGCAMSWRLIQGCTLASPTAAGTPSLHPKTYRAVKKRRREYKVDIKTASSTVALCVFPSMFFLLLLAVTGSW